MSEPEPQIDEEVRALARVLWDYHVINSPLKAADFVLALGSHDERVAIHSACLVRLGLAPLLVVSGGSGKVTGGVWSEPEARRYARIASSMGISDDNIIVEETATNTGDNIRCTREALAQRRIDVRRGILCAKPYMGQRALATARKQWPDIDWQFSGPPIGFTDYAQDDVPELRMIQLLVGDLQRMWAYADQGFQVPVAVPSSVREAYDRLVALGFDKFVIR